MDHWEEEMKAVDILVNTSKCLTMGFSEEEKNRTDFANLYSMNSPTIVDFELPMD